MPTLHSHTHWQAPQANTQFKACQRVCLSDPEKKKLKISFPFKNFKNAYTQTDTKTFGQLVAKLNIDKGCKTQMTRTPGLNRRLAQWRVTWLIEHSTSHLLL
jgi:phage-related protein